METNNSPMIPTPPTCDDKHRLDLLCHRPADRPRLVVDTDTFNEIDDQFALAHVFLAPDLVNLEAVYAAPFVNERSSSPAEGMRKSLAEIHRVRSAASAPDLPILEGSTEWLSEAAADSRQSGRHGLD